jgi:hypothetical protein
MTSDFRGVTSFTRPKSRFGGLNEQPGRRRLFWGTPADDFRNCLSENFVSLQ